MNRDMILARLREIEPRLRARGVAALYLFGSYSRDEATASSDVDLFVDPTDDNFLQLEPFMGAYDDIRTALGGLDVGYGTRNGLSPHIRPAVELQALRVF
jgi:predicted nucleotidyltransferase